MINNDYVNFWKDIRRLNGKCCKLPSKVENTVGESDIAELFKTKYSELYNCVSYSKNEMANLDKKINNGIDALCAKGKCYSDHGIHERHIKNAISTLKRGMKDSNCNLMIDHLMCIWICRYCLHRQYIP